MLKTVSKKTKNKKTEIKGEKRDKFRKKGHQVNTFLLNKN